MYEVAERNYYVDWVENRIGQNDLRRRSRSRSWVWGELQGFSQGQDLCSSVQFKKAFPYPQAGQTGKQSPLGTPPTASFEAFLLVVSFQQFDYDESPVGFSVSVVFGICFVRYFFIASRFWDSNYASVLGYLVFPSNHRGRFMFRLLCPLHACRFIVSLPLSCSSLICHSSIRYAAHSLPWWSSCQWARHLRDCVFIFSSSFCFFHFFLLILFTLSFKTPKMLAGCSDSCL